ncbi:MAG: molybdate ABC transporter substrate-binding protein [bacterium]
MRRPQTGSNTVADRVGSFLDLCCNFSSHNGTILTRNHLWQAVTLLALLGALYGACSRSGGKPDPLRLFAAASLASVMPEVVAEFQARHRTVLVELNFAASSMLAKQIAFGADADIYFSANPQWMDYLEKERRLRPGSRRDVLRNKLVVITPAASGLALTTLRDLTTADIERIALGDWSHVPVGMYAREALQQAGVWPALEARCLSALDARAVLTYVERSEADCGLVYRTDAALSPHVHTAFELPAGRQPDIRYAVAILERSSHPLSADFLAFLRTVAARQIFERYGFEPVEDGAND